MDLLFLYFFLFRTWDLTSGDFVMLTNNLGYTARELIFIPLRPSRNGPFARWLHCFFEKKAHMPVRNSAFSSLHALLSNKIAQLRIDTVLLKSFYAFLDQIFPKIVNGYESLNGKSFFGSIQLFHGYSVFMFPSVVRQIPLRSLILQL